jgi:CDP-diacylglycerol---serine O-phosphatidyltransferase
VRLFGSRRQLQVILSAGITLIGMFCGYLSVSFTLKGAFITAAWFIVAGGVLDALDGPIARVLRGTSEFGGELDSFADLICFGLAPSLLIYRVYFSQWGVVGLVLSFLPTMVCALRLTRYNLAPTDDNPGYKLGFTSTANGLLLASFVIFSRDFSGSYGFPAIAAALVLVSCGLMVSTIPYMTVGKFMAGGVWRTPQGALVLPIVLAVVLFPAKAFFPAMVAMMLQGPLGPRIEHVLHLALRH